MSEPSGPRKRRTRRAARAGDRTQVAREAKDILLKRLAQNLRDDFLTVLGVDLPPIVGAVPAEIPTLNVRAHKPDLLFDLADGSMLDLEFQTTREGTDLRRFSRYNYAAGDHYETRVFTVVVYGAGITEAPDRLDLGSHVFTARNIYIGERDGEAVLAEVRERLGRGEPLRAEERVGMQLLPLMRLRRPLPEVLREAAGLAGALPREERDQTLGTMIGLAYNYIDGLTREQLEEIIRMSNALEQLIADTLTEGIARGREEGIAEGREEGIAEGRMEGQQAMMRKLIRQRFGHVPPALDRRIATADPAALDRLLASVSAASRVEDVLDDV